MAKAPKTMTPADKKLAQAGLKQALKNHNDGVKAVCADFTLAQKALALAKKSADSRIKEATKTFTAVRKASDVTMAAATKVFAAAQSKNVKQLAAAAKGSDKLNAHIAALDLVPTAAPVAVKTLAAAVIAKAQVVAPATQARVVEPA